MNVNLQIREITFHGVPLERCDVPAMREALYAQLEKRIANATNEQELQSLFTDRVSYQFDPLHDATGLGESLADSLAGPNGLDARGAIA